MGTILAKNVVKRKPGFEINNFVFSPETYITSTEKEMSAKRRWLVVAKRKEDKFLI